MTISYYIDIITVYYFIFDTGTTGGIYVVWYIRIQSTEPALYITIIHSDRGLCIWYRTS